MDGAVAVRMILTDRWGVQLGTLSDVRECLWTDVLNGEDALTLSTTTPVSKGDRVVWRDHLGEWHEHVVASVEQSDEGEAVYRAECENSISELFGDYIMDRKPRDATASEALGIVLEPTRWEAGEVGVEGAHSKNFFRVSCREALHEVVETWGGELWATIEVEGCEVVARKVNLSRRGSDSGLRLEYGRDMDRVSRTYSADDVATALYGFGKGERVDEGHSDGIDFGAINGGKTYVEDAEARERWGRADGKGGKAHVFGKVEFPDCEDPAELLELTRSELDARKEPKVSYEASVRALSDYGYGFGGAGVGDRVAIIDRALEPELRVGGRVTKVVRDMLDGGRADKVTVGNVVEDLADLMASQGAEVRSLTARASAWDVAANAPTGYVLQIMDGMNELSAQGGALVEQTPEEGISSRAADGSSALRIKGGELSAAGGDGAAGWRVRVSGGGVSADRVSSALFVLGEGEAVCSAAPARLPDGGWAAEVELPGGARLVLGARSLSLSAGGLSVEAGEDGPIAVRNLSGSLEVDGGTLSVGADGAKVNGMKVKTEEGGE